MEQSRRENVSKTEKTGLGEGELVDIRSNIATCLGKIYSLPREKIFVGVVAIVTPNRKNGLFTRKIMDKTEARNRKSLIVKKIHNSSYFRCTHARFLSCEKWPFSRSAL